MSYSRRELYAMGEPLGESVTRKEGGRIVYGGGGGGGPTSSTTNTSNIPDWLRPQVEAVLGGSMQELFDFTKKPGVTAEDGTVGDATYDITGVKKDAFKPYSTDPREYVAGFSPLQQQVQYNAANLQMPGQYNQATGLTGMGGMGALGTAQQAVGYGQQGARMGSDYLNAVSNTYNPTTGKYEASNAIGAFMSPYTQNVVDVQNQAAQRQADIAKTQRMAQATKAGAFGGSRQAIENAEADRALQNMMNNNQLQAQQAAYQSALQNMQYGAGLGLQGLGVGLQGVSGAQQGYGLAGQAGANLANIGNQQLGAQQGILGLQSQIGGQQQAQEQQIINQAIQNYANQQQAPMQAYNQYNALLRGYAIPGMTTTQYQAAPSMTSQIAGLGTAAAGAYGLMKKKGGAIKEPKGQGIDSLGLRNALNAGK
jgi:hypothetical protein